MPGVPRQLCRPRSDPPRGSLEEAAGRLVPQVVGAQIFVGAGEGNRTLVVSLGSAFWRAEPEHENSSKLPDSIFNS
jgi:hypothetical protein